MKILNIPPASIPYIDRHRAIVNAKKNNIKGVTNQVKLNLLSLDNQVASRYTDFELAIQNNQLFNFIESPSLKLNKDDLLLVDAGIKFKKMSLLWDNYT